ncbi:Rna-binding protein [Thalictrum thalictroides]|uniref:Rna-binding protein n=1 Tax=Thalictrum thalictroides TaxID=46969 RepID=A0A7J6XFL4_THATH|nr:Rna-binding protein [Thalictrum thalictroides]
MKHHSKQNNTMKSIKLPPIREIGQLRLPSCFLRKPSNSSNEPSHEDATKMKSGISLSEFLNRKLDKDRIPPKTVQRKQIPFATLLERKDRVGTINEHIGMKRRAEITPILDETVFKQFKHPKIANEVYHTSSKGGEIEGSTIIEEKDLENRNPFHVSSLGAEKRSTTASRLLVIGDDPKPKFKRRAVNSTLNGNPKPLYNHYANGSGWWDCDMEGIDSEEVGCSNAWEGMGATTNLGGLEWH